jgi:hypothetical protein
MWGAFSRGSPSSFFTGNVKIVVQEQIIGQYPIVIVEFVVRNDLRPGLIDSGTSYWAYSGLFTRLNTIRSERWVLISSAFTFLS